MLLLSSAGCVGGCNGTIEVIDSQISLLRVPEITNDTLYSNNSSNATIPDKATWQSSAVVLGKKGELYNLTCHELNCSWDLLPWNLVTSNSSIRSSLSEVLPWLIKCPEVPPQQWSFKWRPIDRKTQAYHTHYHNGKLSLEHVTSQPSKLLKLSTLLTPQTKFWLREDFLKSQTLQSPMLDGTSPARTGVPIGFGD